MVLRKPETDLLEPVLVLGLGRRAALDAGGAGGGPGWWPALIGLAICAACPRLCRFFCLTASLILSTSYWYLFLSLIAPSLASFNAVSRAFTLSMVALSLFSSLGSSHLRSALSLTSCLCTLVSWSRLFSRKEIFCFCAREPPASSESSPAADFFTLDWRSCTNSFLRLCSVCSSLATVSSSPFRSCLACSRLSLRAISSCSRLDFSCSSSFNLSWSLCRASVARVSAWLESLSSSMALCFSVISFLRVATCFWCCSLCWESCSSSASFTLVSFSCSSEATALICSVAFSWVTVSLSPSRASSSERFLASESFSDSFRVFILASCCTMVRRQSPSSFSITSTFFKASTRCCSSAEALDTKFFASDFILDTKSLATVNSSSTLPSLLGSGFLRSWFLAMTEPTSPRSVRREWSISLVRFLWLAWHSLRLPSSEVAELSLLCCWESSSLTVLYSLDLVSASCDFWS